MSGNEPAKEARPHKEREAEERRLIEAAQSDPERFADVYENYFELVYAYVARRARNRDEAEDLTGEVFRKALASLPRFKWRGAPFAAWLFRIASNRSPIDRNAWPGKCRSMSRARPRRAQARR